MQKVRTATKQKNFSPSPPFFVFKHKKLCLNTGTKHALHTTKKSAYRGGFEKLKTASIDYQTASIDMNALKTASKNFKSAFISTASIDMNAL